ncbi:MAG: glycerol kinase GlpK [Lachnospiraceae bacterium]|nr:glycerol kinase GlpK [Lachnospiraceae bacterium]
MTAENNTKNYIMALDQGTTSSRCILFNRQGEICSIAQKEYTQYYPQPGWVEHDPMEIWSSQYGVMMEAMTKLGATAKDIAAIGITNQRETTIVWEKETGKPVYPAIVWQCRRTSEMVDELKEKGLGEMISRKTGLVPDAYFSATKIAWILGNVEGAARKAEEGKLLFGTVDTWLIWKLTGGKVHVTDFTNASRTMLYNIHNLCWDQELLELFKIPASMMPKVSPSSCVYGETAKELTGIPIPIAGAAGDQQAALFGQCCFEEGQVKNTYGTGCFLLMNTGKEPVVSRHGLVTTLTATSQKTPGYALEGSVFVAGAVIQWLRDELEMIKSAPQTEEICQSVSDTGGVYLVPAFTGLGAPYWNQYARGTIVGLTRGTKKAHFVRAAVESLAYQVKDVVDAMEKDSGLTVSELKADGGASANNFLLQFQADIMNASVDRPSCTETTALGAAYLAGLAVGYWKDLDEIRSNWKLEQRFESSMEDSVRQTLIRGWKKAVDCSCQFI